MSVRILVGDARERLDSMTEKQLMEAIVEAAGYLGYRQLHVYDMRRSDTGWPDLFLARERDGRRYALECKTEKGKVAPDQLEWLTVLAACGIPAMIVRPRDLDYVLEMLK